MPFPDSHLASAIYLSARRTEQPSGTAFLVRVPASEAKASYVYAVTARHCVERAALPGTITLKANLKAGGLHEVETDTLDWFSHDNADVAAIAYEPTVDPRLLAVRTVPHDVLVASDWRYYGPPFKNKLFAPVGVGDPVRSVGLLAEAWGTSSRALPVCRGGIVARMPERIRFQRPDETAFDAVAYLADLQSWPGHSGSPVFWGYPQSVRQRLSNGDSFFLTDHIWPLLGLMSGHFPIATEAQVTGDFMGSVTTPLNSGVAVVTPASAISELLERGDVVADRLQRTPR